MEKEFITYGFFIDPEQIKVPGSEKDNKTYYLNKPAGGLWGSPTTSNWGWKDWCISQDFRVESLKEYTKWRLKPETKILIIDSYDDFQQAMDKYGWEENIFSFSRYYLDFRKIMDDGFSGIYLTEDGNDECHSPDCPYKRGYIDLNTWDCESIVIWDKTQIEIIEKGRL